MVRKHHKPLEQVVRRYEEQMKNLIVESTSVQNYRNLVFNYGHNNGPLLETASACGPQYLKITLITKIMINIRNSSDKYILTKAV